jgi:Ni/Fe-hydrogenase subunit HybB-like protein
MSGHDRPQPVGGNLFDPLMKLMILIWAAAAVIMPERFAHGIGPVSNMTDGYPWGIWEPVNVVVFTGIGSGAYAVGLLCYVLGKEKYHWLLRPAVLLGAIAYTLGAGSILVALGRYWNGYLLGWAPFWNLASALLEVAICVISYVTVLWVEVLPSALEGAEASASSRWSAFGRRWRARLSRAMPYILALAVVLPTMHQSSLGGLMLIAGPKIHPLWHTALLPTLFLVSCVSMGFGALVILFNILNLTWHARYDHRLFADLSAVNAWILLAYVALRLADAAWSGKLHLLGANSPTFLFALELALFALPALLFLWPRVRGNRGGLFGASFLVVAAGALYRVDTYLTMFRPMGWTAAGVPRPSGWDYFPSLGELAVTLGVAAYGVSLFIFLSRTFPVVVLASHPHRAETGRPLPDLAATPEG